MCNGAWDNILIIISFMTHSVPLQFKRSPLLSLHSTYTHIRTGGVVLSIWFGEEKGGLHVALLAHLCLGVIFPPHDMSHEVYCYDLTLMSLIPSESLIMSEAARSIS